MTDLVAGTQYPSSLGSTVVELRGVMPNNTLTVSKTAFTMLGTPAAGAAAACACGLLPWDKDITDFMLALQCQTCRKSCSGILMSNRCP